MADRMHPYPMFSQNHTPASLQQPQIPQQPPQAQQPDPQMLSALSNPEHSRMWQMNQLQNAYRPQQPPDLAASQMNHQMQEFVRGQALSHGQGQPIVQQIQQSFGLNAQRINPPGPVFHDPQANLSQLLVPANSPNVAMNTQQQMKNAFNMNPMMHAMGNPGVPRQLNLLKQQQEMARLQQSGLGAQHAPNQTAADMFVSAAMQPSHDQMHGSPHPSAQPMAPPGANQTMVPGNPQQKRVIPTDFQDRRNYLLNLVSQTEGTLTAVLQSVRNPAAAAADPALQQQISRLRSELVARKEMYNRFVASFGGMVTQQMANGVPSSTVPHINPMASQQPQQGTMSNPQVQPGFVGQANPPVTAPYNIPAASGPSPIPTQSQATLNQQLPLAATQIGRPGTIPPRTGGTPLQAPGGQLPNNVSPNLGNFVPPGGQKVPNPNQARLPTTGVMPLPLDKAKFESTYRSFCRSQNKPNPELQVLIGDKMVDLHQLHVCVMHEGGASAVTQHEMWETIGGRLKFVHFPGNDSEAARSGPVIAHQLQAAYEQHLQHFENAYIATVRNRTGGGSPQQQIHQMNPNALAMANNVTSSLPGNPAEMPPNPSRTVNPQFVAIAARYAHATVQEMRAQRVPDQIINFVERHRPDLQKLYQQQVQQLVAKRNAEQEQQNNPNAQGQLPNVPEHTPMGLQPGVQRVTAIGANNMVGVPQGDSKMVNGNFMHENAATALDQQQPTAEQIQNAQMMIHQFKTVFHQRSLSTPVNNFVPVPDEQRLEYNQLLDQVFKMTSVLDSKLHMYYAVFRNEEIIRKYIAIVMTVAKQRHLLATSSPQYIISLANLRNMQMQIQKLNDEFENRLRAMRASAAAANSQPHATLASIPARKTAPSPLAVPPVQNQSQIVPPVPLNSGRPLSVNPSPPQQTHLQPPAAHPQPQPQPLPPPQPPSHTQPSQLSPQPPSSISQPPKKPFQIPRSPSTQPAATSIASPTPPPAAAASSSTPATSAPTPQTAAGSPQTPKSPPTKVATRGKATSRVTRKLSAAGKGSATPETASSTVVGIKRPPEEEVPTLTNVAPSEAETSNAPSPKKAKTEWEGEASEALVKRQQEVENIKTDEDATMFFDHMKELLAMSSPTENGIHSDIASSLDQILAGVAQEPADAAATAAALAVHGDTGPPPTALSPHMGPANDAFLLEYIDFSSFTTLDDEDNDSKAPTPDLVSETGPSPESGSEGDSLGNSGSPDKAKIEEAGDPLRLGSLREIDGGESAYYQADSWKWEGPMHTVDQPWAMFTS